MRPTSGNPGRPSSSAIGADVDTKTSKRAAVVDSTAMSTFGLDALGVSQAVVMHWAAQPLGPPSVKVPFGFGEGSGAARPALAAWMSTYWLKPLSLTLIRKVMASV